MRARLLSLILLAAAPPALADGPGFQVVVHPSNPAESISRELGS